MVERSFSSFPPGGVDVHVSVDEALVHGIHPGDPAVIEVTLRAYTAEERMSEVSVAKPVASREEGATIRWTSGAPTASVATAVAVAEPATAGVLAQPATIRWRSDSEPRPLVTLPSAEPEAPPVAALGEQASPSTIRWRSGDAPDPTKIRWR